MLLPIVLYDMLDAEYTTELLFNFFNGFLAPGSAWNRSGMKNYIDPWSQNSF